MLYLEQTSSLLNQLRVAVGRLVGDDYIKSNLSTNSLKLWTWDVVDRHFDRNFDSFIYPLETQTSTEL